MNIDPLEARAAALSLEDAQRKLHSAENRLAGNITLLWGAAYVIAPLTMILWPKSHFIMGSLVILCAVIATIVFSLRSPVKSESGWKFGAMWWIACAFAYVWVFTLLPFSHAKPPVVVINDMQLWTFGVSVAMFIYAVMGLFCWPRLYLWLSLLVTALTVVGLFALPGIFWIWTAVTAGGTLLAGGLVVRLRRVAFRP